MNKRAKIVTIALSVCLVVFLAAGLLVGNFFYSLAIDPHADKSSVTESEANQISFDINALSAGDRWLAESGYEAVQMQTWDDLALRGYRIENPTGRGWVILNHGYCGWAKQLGYYAQNFYEMGFSILLVDARGHGASEGEYMGMGVHDRLDLLEWVNALNRHYNDPDIVLFGVSMGGATVMAASGEELPPNVKAVVEDCGYTSTQDEFSYQLKVLFGLPAFPVIHFSSLVTKVRAGFWFSEYGALEQVAKSTTPTLFIHGSEDTFVPAGMLQQLYDACTAPKEMLMIDGAGHGGAATENPGLYWPTVEAFLAQYV